MHSVARHRPHFSERDAEKIARDLYGLTCSARELPSERDQNFHLGRGSGKRFVLKIASSSEREEVLDLQNKALEHLAKTSPSLLCPRLCPTLSGRDIAAATGPDGARHFVRLLTFLPGVFFADVRPHTPGLLRSLGRFFGSLDKALAGFTHKAASRDLQWNLKSAGAVIRRFIPDIGDPGRRALLEGFLRHFEKEVAPLLPGLRTCVIHNDGNDHNVLVAREPRQESGSWGIKIGIIDFGDMLESYSAGEPAIAAAYALLGKANPLAAAAQVVGGFHEVFPLTESELEALYPLMCLRLCTSVALSAHQRKQEPEKTYLSISEEPAWNALEKLAGVHPRFAHYAFRSACNLPPCPASRIVAQWLRDQGGGFGPIVEPDPKAAGRVLFDLSVGSHEMAEVPDPTDARQFTAALFGRMKAQGAILGLGRYDEARRAYLAEQYAVEGDEGPEWRTIHIGADLFVEPGTPVYSPLEGAVHSFRNNAQPLDYGPTIILEHDMGQGRGSFYTLYGHLSPDSLQGLRPGMALSRGAPLGRIGDASTNGGWPPHLHFQIIADLLGCKGDFPGVACARDRDLWLSLCPDPNLLLDLPELRGAAPGMSAGEILQVRRRHTSPALSLSYRQPLKIVRGFMQHLYDDTGRPYLDAVNNVPHVGHCHPRVVRAARQQIAVLNTNTRYLHENLACFAQRLCSTLPEPLRICFFVNSGSEANDLALRLARTRTGRKDIVVVDGAYHGNLTSLIEISPYKFDGPGGSGAPPHVHKVAMPDVYRGLCRDAGPQAGAEYARLVEAAACRARSQGGGIAAFICESALSCGGQIILPPGYLEGAYRHVREAGGLCIADEVQVGFGRLGSHFWGFQTQDVVPDIVTMGKPIGNGHPLGAVVTTPDIAAAFDNGMEYFNTYGGNPVSCAVGLAVLDVLQEESLQAKALATGSRLKAGLEQLMQRHRWIGNVRGAGLFLGVELVSDRETLAPAAEQASYAVERMRERGILLSTDGPLHNVIKIKPPMVFTEADGDRLVATLDKTLAELAGPCLQFL